MRVQFPSCVYRGGRSIKENERYIAKGLTTQTCFTKKSSLILGKLTGKHLWWRLFSGFRSATLVKKILMNKPFSVNGCKHLWTSASESNLRMSTILFFFLLYIRYKGRIKRFKGVPLMHLQVNLQLQRQMHLFLEMFLQIFVLLKVKS